MEIADALGRRHALDGPIRDFAAGSVRVVAAVPSLSPASLYNWTVAPAGSVMPSKLSTIEVAWPACGSGSTRYWTVTPEPFTF